MPLLLNASPPFQYQNVQGFFESIISKSGGFLQGGKAQETPLGIELPHVALSSISF
jgi:hypothetical protein